MWRRVAVLALAGVLGSSVVTQHAIADGDPALPTGGDDTDGTVGEDRDDAPVTVNENGDVVALAPTPGTTVTSGGGSSGPACRPRPAVATESDSNAAVPGHQRTNPVTGVIETWYVLCGGPPARYAWVPTDIDEDIVIDGAVAQAIARIPLPVPDVNPAPDVGSYVNLGLWFAVAPPDPIEITATAVAGTETFSVTASVELLTTAFDPGDGSDPVSCADHGVPIVRDSADWNDVAPGPCGHVYLQSSPDESPYRLSMTSTHEVRWSASDGRTGSAGTVDLATVVDYDVDELQTRGTS